MSFWDSKLGITDDDRCASCIFLHYNPGGDSWCEFVFPFDSDAATEADSYGEGCDKYEACAPAANYDYPGMDASPECSGVLERHQREHWGIPPGKR